METRRKCDCDSDWACTHWGRWGSTSLGGFWGSCSGWHTVPPPQWWHLPVTTSRLNICSVCTFWRLSWTAFNFHSSHPSPLKLSVLSFWQQWATVFLPFLWYLMLFCSSISCNLNIFTFSVLSPPFFHISFFQEISLVLTAIRLYNASVKGSGLWLFIQSALLLLSNSFIHSFIYFLFIRLCTLF